ncbi:homoprotocatechuate degradation operon regulator HpaR [Taklimakanibacter deserti]|uniref:homoprotocatechuate degradation operon regulator HpaR n=1 Tax=Taklimakanibacter deserti TaxID=2267839 RepID=UPI000E64646A
MIGSSKLAERPKADTLPPIRQSLPMAFLRAREAVMARFRPLLAAHDVSEQQWRVIRVLGESGPLDATEVARRCCIMKPSLTRIIRALAQRKLIIRRKDDDDGRRLILDATPKAHEMITSMMPQINVVYDALEQEFGKDRLEQLLVILEELTETRPS